MVQPSSTTTSAPAPSDRFEVTGTLSELSADRAVGDPVPPPFTITVAERGVGGAEIAGATVGGQPVQINWDAGRPLPVSGRGGGLDLGAAPITVRGSAVRWSLDGAARTLLPGPYSLGSSVAVGSGGLAKPVDSLAFIAGNDAALSTRGGAAIDLPAGRLRVEGREGSLTLTGRLELASSTATRSVTKVAFGPGVYEVTLTPVGAGFDVLARLAGRVTA